MSSDGKTSNTVGEGDDRKSEENTQQQQQKGTKVEQKKVEQTFQDTLEVTVRSGRELQACDGETSDPYVKVILVGANGEVVIGKSRTEKATLFPEWDLKVLDLSVEVIAAHSRIGNVTALRFEVWDHDTFSPDDFMGQALFPLKDPVVHPIEHLLHLHPRHGRNDKVHGGITVTVHYVRRDRTGLFGADITRSHVPCMTVADEVFAAFDTNDDGVLSLGEATEVFAQLKAKWIKELPGFMRERFDRAAKDLEELTDTVVEHEAIHPSLRIEGSSDDSKEVSSRKFELHERLVRLRQQNERIIGKTMVKYNKLNERKMAAHMFKKLKVKENESVSLELFRKTFTSEVHELRPEVGACDIPIECSIM